MLKSFITNQAALKQMDTIIAEENKHINLLQSYLANDYAETKDYKHR